MVFVSLNIMNKNVEPKPFYWAKLGTLNSSNPEGSHHRTSHIKGLLYARLTLVMSSFYSTGNNTTLCRSVLGGSPVFQRQNQGVRFQVYPWPRSSTKIRESVLIHNESSQKIEGWTDQITYLEPPSLAGSFVRPTHQFSEDAQKSRSRGYNKIKQQPASGIDQLVTEPHCSQWFWAAPE
jgi:hypothetical protein